jgi:glyoxylase-like metal-dependent hydrolase (beta-lactamase superfamily II)
VFTEIAQGVFAVSHRLVDGKNAIVFGTRGALAIDACNYLDEGEAMAAFIRDHGAAPNRLAITHGHGDHVLGSGAFRGADVYAHVAAPRTIDAYLNTWAERYFGGSTDTCQAALSRPNMLFDHALCIDLGGKTVRLFGTPGHCPDAVCAYIEQDGILCAGEWHLVRGAVPERITQDADYAIFVGDRLAEVPFGMPRRHRMLVARIVAEVEADRHR